MIFKKENIQNIKILRRLVHVMECGWNYIIKKGQFATRVVQ